MYPKVPMNYPATTDKRCPECEKSDKLTQTMNMSGLHYSCKRCGKRALKAEDLLPAEEDDEEDSDSERDFSPTPREIARDDSYWEHWNTY